MVNIQCSMMAGSLLTPQKCFWMKSSTTETEALWGYLSRSSGSAGIPPQRHTCKNIHKANSICYDVGKGCGKTAPWTSQGTPSQAEHRKGLCECMLPNTENPEPSTSWDLSPSSTKLLPFVPGEVSQFGINPLIRNFRELKHPWKYNTWNIFSNE